MACGTEDRYISEEVLVKFQEDGLLTMKVVVGKSREGKQRPLPHYKMEMILF